MSTYATISVLQLFFVLIFVKTPSPYLSSNLFYYFFLPSFIPSIPFLFHFSLLTFVFLFPSFSFSHR